MTHKPEDGQFEIRTSNPPQTWCKNCGQLYYCDMDTGAPLDVWYQKPCVKFSA